jgi:glucosamine-6-phosphate deaminase
MQAAYKRAVDEIKVQDMKSAVEQKILETRQQELKLPGEQIPVIVVDNFPMLGRLTALRFLEWVQDNPEGVVSLPTGKTPEYFIKEVIRYKNSWSSKETQKELGGYGIDTSKKPDFRGLTFVQIDEFYPINPRHHNSFYYYVNKYYLEGFGIPRQKALLINCEEIGLDPGTTLEEVWRDEAVDLSLRYRNGKTDREILRKKVIERIDQWCVEYEDKVRSLGGIGFFLGGIGPDGHVGFNIRGSSLYSTTRLTPVNYETKAASASDLGGIEVAEKRLVITIGLSTITYNPDCVAVIMAAGEAKAGIVAEAVENDRDVLYPASSLQSLPNGRFYLTEGAAKKLRQREITRLLREEELSEEETARLVIDVALSLGKEIEKLTEEDYRQHPCGTIVLKKGKKKIKELNSRVADSLKRKIEEGMRIRKGKTFLHTEPHHDDIMLGYMPFVVRHIREHSNTHHFTTMTSGFTSVTNDYMLKLCLRMKRALQRNKYNFYELIESGYFNNENIIYRDHDVYTYLDGLAARNPKIQEQGTLTRFLRDLIQVFEDTDLDNLMARVDELINYFETQYPGKKDLPYIQTLKGMCREWESACLWGYFGWDSTSISHLRLGFYTGDIFTEEPTLGRDVPPILELMKKADPQVLTVAFDPEASGPDTHYKVMQSITEALKLYEEEKSGEDMEIIGYRNVWYRFHPSEANIFVPVSLNMLTLQHESFINTYISQKDASFPSYEYDGPFSLLAQKIQVEQYNNLATCLGRRYFYDHESALIRATRGFVFLKSMNRKEFYSYTRALRKKTEAR